MRGCQRMLHHTSLQPALHQHLRLLQVPVCGRLRSLGAQPRHVQGAVRSGRIFLISHRAGYRRVTAGPTGAVTLYCPSSSRGAFSHNGRPPGDPEAECGWFKLHHPETGKRYTCVSPTVPVGKFMSNYEIGMLYCINIFSMK